MSIKAVIDLGTNTCNLLIAESSGNGNFHTLYDRKLPVKMGRGGIHKKLLLPDAIERGIKAFERHAENIRKFGVSQVKVVATSAIRGAANRDEFISEIKKRFGWDIEVINGEREAELIFKGVSRSLPPLGGKYLILDIGGGSNEFILVKDQNIIWKQSFNIGVARTLEHFKLTDPPSLKDTKLLENWYHTNLKELFDICRLHQPKILIGCSGAFDTFMDIWQQAPPDETIREASEFPLEIFKTIHQLLLNSNEITRSKIKGMDKNRVEMIVVASIFTNFILEKLEIRKLIHTHYALKEGVMTEIIDS
jgi:exopolyphosphatase/guanosine-5'-triphosphate,3'-diphosphate pyrophosphatase